MTVAADASANESHDPVELMRRLSGVDFLRTVFFDKPRSVAIGRTLDFGATEIDAGRVVFEGRPSAQFYNPIGTVHGGYALTMLDSCMSCAVQSMLSAGWGYITVEMKTNFVKAITDKTGIVRAEGKAINVGSRIGTAEGRVTDKDGKLLAFGTTTCLIFQV